MTIKILLTILVVIGVLCIIILAMTISELHHWGTEITWKSFWAELKPITGFVLGIFITLVFISGLSIGLIYILHLIWV